MGKMKKGIKYKGLKEKRKKEEQRRVRKRNRVIGGEKYGKAHLYIQYIEQYMGAKNRDGIEFSYRPDRYIGWRNRFLGIYSWAP